MILLNKKGGVLHIVLILFISLTFFLSLFLNQLIKKFEIYEYISIMEKQKTYEIYLVYYFKDMIINDILLSDDIEFDGYVFRYDVLVDYTSYIITVFSDHPYFNYIIEYEIDMDTLNVLNFEYRKEI